MVVLAAPRILPAALGVQAGRIAAALQQEAAHHTATGAAPNIDADALQFTRVTDQANCRAGYEGVWRDARNRRCGTLTFNSDGSFYAEYDLFCPHPSDVRWFVEMVTAWGTGDVLRCEAKLIPSL